MAEAPIIVQLFPSLEPQTIIFINRLGQIIAIIFGIQTLYETRIYNFLISNLSFIGKLQNYAQIVISKKRVVLGIGTGKRFHKEVPQEDQLDLKILLPLSLIIIALALFASEKNPIYWFYYPFLQFRNMVTIWDQFDSRILSFLIMPIRSILYFLWGFISFLLIYSLVLTILIRTLGVVANKLSNLITSSVYRVFLLFELIIASILVYIT